LPEEDLASGDGENTGCLISEVVVPGFSFEDHCFLSAEKLVELFRGGENAEGVEELMQYVRNE
jgi:predicted cupin superfamily sugar epimerase